MRTRRRTTPKSHPPPATRSTRSPRPSERSRSAASTPVRAARGNTPTSSLLDDAGPITEIRPGNYVFNDATQVALGVAAEADCALSVLATVLSRPDPRRLILDCGSKALAAERLTPRTVAFGLVAGHPELVVERLYEEHAIVTSPEPTDIPLGSRLRVVPITRARRRTSTTACMSSRTARSPTSGASTRAAGSRSRGLSGFEPLSPPHSEIGRYAARARRAASTEGSAAFAFASGRAFTVADRGLGRDGDLFARRRVPALAPASRVLDPDVELHDAARSRTSLRLRELTEDDLLERFEDGLGVTFVASGSVGNLADELDLWVSAIRLLTLVVDEFRADGPDGATTGGRGSGIVRPSARNPECHVSGAEGPRGPRLRVIPRGERSPKPKVQFEKGKFNLYVKSHKWRRLNSLSSMIAKPPSAELQRRGRPRSERAQLAILAAASDLLYEQGLTR